MAAVAAGYLPILLFLLVALGLSFAFVVLPMIVARFTGAHQPDPQKLEDLREILKEFKLKLRGNVEEIRPGELQRVLKEVAGRPEERFLTNLVLRSMKRAFSRVAS